MKKQFTAAFILVIFLIPFSVWGWGVIGMGGSPAAEGNGNNFSGDANCVALWKFENGALTADSKGSNTLTDHNTVGVSTTDYKEGSASADFVKAQYEYFSITDTDLDAGFPFRAGDGTPGDDISLCFWMKPDILGTNDYIFSKYNIGLNKRTFSVLILTQNLAVNIGHDNGDSGLAYQFGTTMDVDKWYHVGITFQNADSNSSSIRIRIWDDGASALLAADYTTSSAKTINIEDATLCVADREGGTDRLYGGHIDEMVVFKDILSVAEIDLIRAGTYP